MGWGHWMALMRLHFNVDPYELNIDQLARMRCELEWLGTITDKQGATPIGVSFVK